MWTLIWTITLFHGSYKAVSVTTNREPGFQSYKSCTDAAGVMRRDAHGRPPEGEYRFQWSCVQK